MGELAGSSHPFETHCVIEFSSRCTDDLRIESSQSVNGAEFRCRLVKDANTKNRTYLHVCAPNFRLMEIAEWLEIMKPDLIDGNLREFSVKAINRFVPISQDIDAVDLFTPAEKSRMVFYELNELRADGDELDKFHTSNAVRFSSGQSIISKLQRRGLILRVFPLHDKETLRRLATNWYKGFTKEQPIDEIRNYFGEHIAVYFAFLGFYTRMLAPAALFGLMMFFANYFGFATLTSTIAFAVFNIFWAAVFFERWKRYCNRLAYGWGTLGKVFSILERPRAQFKGAMGKNPVTGEPEPVYPSFLRNLWIVLVSGPVVTFCLLLSMYLLSTYLRSQAYLASRYLKEPTMTMFLLKFTPSTFYSMGINVLRTVYKYIATWLTDKENHRLQRNYEYHLIWKLLLFNFINSFASLFYIAFWLQDISALRSILATQLIVNQMIDHFPETVWPYIKVTFDKWKARRTLDKEDKKREKRGEVEEDEIFAEYRKQAIVESERPEYPGTFDDYLEIFLQFGYCFLFSSAFPIAAVFAFVNNLIEIRGDGLKMCTIMQRPFAVAANSIGPWQLAFELIGFAAVMTNLALIYTSPLVREYFPKVTDFYLLLAFVLIEHVLIFAKLAFAHLYPTVPHGIQLEMAKMEYEMKKAIKDKRAEETRKEILARRISVTQS